MTQVVDSLDDKGTLIERRWFKDRACQILHRVDGPAVTRPAYVAWMFDGKLHCDGAPALIDENVGRYWYQHGKCHRTDGPAKELNNGDKYWYVDGIRHRTDGPAIEKVDGTQEWYFEGELHRMDGPAVIQPNREPKWFIYGDEFHETQFHQRVAYIAQCNKED